MASALVGVGYKVTVTFGTSAFAHQLKNVRWSGAKRKVHDVTHMLTPLPTGTQFGGREFLPSPTADPGSVEGDLQFNPDNPLLLNTLINETVTVRWYDLTTDATWSAARGWVEEHSVEASEDEVMMAHVKIKLSGSVTIVVGV